MADSVFTPEQEARINDLLVEYLQQNGASIDAGVNVTELTGDALTDENLKKLTIPSILPNTNEWAYTSLENMMAPIQHAISHLQTEDAQVQTTINNAATATQTANTAAANADAKAAVADTAAAGAANVNATVEGSVIIVTDRAGVEHRTNLEIGIYATFTSVADMNAHAVSVPDGKLVVIATSDPTSAENARLYIRNSLAATAAEPFDFLCDLDQASAAAWADWLENMKPVIEDAITTAAADHTQAVSDHQTASSDHTTAGTDHNTATTDHTQAGSDHTTALNDHTQAGSDHTASVSATSDANEAAALANTKAGLADTAAANANTKATLADEKATLANTAATSANNAATLATQKAGTADTAANNANTKATYAQQQGDYAKEWNDHPPYIADGTAEHRGDPYYMYLWDINTHAYVRGAYVKGADLDYSTMTQEEYERLVENVKNSVLFASVQTCEDIIDELN